MRYHIDEDQVSERVFVRTFYPCADVDCTSWDEPLAKQTVVVAEREYLVSSGERRVSAGADIDGRVLLLVNNNHSAFICSLCDSGRVDYLAEVAEMRWAAVRNMEARLSWPTLSVTIAYSDDQSDEIKTLTREVFMGSGYSGCNVP